MTRNFAPLGPIRHRKIVAQRQSPSAAEVLLDDQCLLEPDFDAVGFSDAYILTGLGSYPRGRTSDDGNSYE